MTKKELALSIKLNNLKKDYIEYIYIVIKEIYSINTKNLIKSINLSIKKILDIL